MPKRCLSCPESLSRRHLLRGSVCAAAASLMPVAALAQSGSKPADKPDISTEVDLLLVLAADVSRSVDARKFALQRDGYAAALVDEDVLRAIGRGKWNRIGINYIEWSGANEQTVIVDWTLIDGRTTAEAVAGKIHSAPRPHYGRTSIAGAIDVGLAQIARAPFKAPRSLIDISGDGTHNAGRTLEDARRDAQARDVNINALVILSEVPLAFNPAHTHPPGGLLAWFEENVIAGEGAFAIAAQNFEDFGRSLRTKLIREIA